MPERTIHHANSIIDSLMSRRSSNGRIAPVRASELIASLGLIPQHYSVAFGQAVSLLDIACLMADLPWFGRLVQFDKSREANTSSWGIWEPEMQKLIEAPKVRCWSSGDVAHIRTHWPLIGADKWWRIHESESEALLRRALLAARDAQ